MVCGCDAVFLFPVSGFRSHRHVLQLQSIPAQHLQVQHESILNYYITINNIAVVYNING